MIETLGRSGCDMNAAVDGGRSALHVAAQFGYADCIHSLLQQKADANSVDLQGCSALATAKMHHNDHCAAALSAAGGILSVFESVEEGDTGSIAALGHAGCNLNIVDRDGRPALHRAVVKGDAACIEALVVAGAHVHVLDLQGNSALFLAKRYRSQDCIDALEACGARLRATEAAEVGDAQTIECLALQHADLNQLNMQGLAAVHIACERSFASCVDALVQAGANVDKRDALGWAPVHKAACSGSALCISALARGGANLDILSPDGCAALHQAAAACHAECITALLQARCAVMCCPLSQRIPALLCCN